MDGRMHELKGTKWLNCDAHRIHLFVHKMKHEKTEKITTATNHFCHLVFAIKIHLPFAVFVVFAAVAAAATDAPLSVLHNLSSSLKYLPKF